MEPPVNEPQQPVAPPVSSPTPTQPAPVAPAGATQTNGFAITALILGIVAFIFGWLGAFNLLVAALSIVFGIVALKKGQKKGFALTGLILGGIGLITSLIFAIWLGAAFLGGVSEGIKNEASKSDTTQTDSSQIEPSSDTTKSWDVEAIYEKLTTGMTKADVEATTSRTSNDCSESSSSFGTSETCTYGNVLTDGGSITVSYSDGALSFKSKYKSTN